MECKQQRMAIVKAVVTGGRRLREALYSWLATQLDTNKPLGAIAALDGVRACAALIVVAYHVDLITRDSHLWEMSSANQLLSAVVLSGFSGVTLFFVLSGFLLFMPYARSLLVDRPWPETRTFYLRRALRIMPGYYFSLFVFIMFWQPAYLEPRHWKDLLLFVLFLMDSTQSTFRQLNGPYWTLAIEWQFYILLPWIALGIGLIARRVRVAWRIGVASACLVALMGWGLWSRAWGEWYIQHPAAATPLPRGIFNDILFVTYGYGGKFLEDFAVGMLAGLLFVYFRDPARAARVARPLRRLSPALWAVGLALLLFTSMRNHSQAAHVSWPFANSVFLAWDWALEIGFALGYGCCIMAILYGSPRIKHIFEWAPLRAIGLISYSLYIWHLPLLIAFKDHIAANLRQYPDAVVYGLYWVWVAAIILPFAAVAYVLIEKPGMRLSDRLRYHIAAHQARETERAKEAVEAG